MKTNITLYEEAKQSCRDCREENCPMESCPRIDQIYGQGESK
jgi:hypothetical protein